MTQTKNATIDDLARVAEHGKAELIDGAIIPMSPTGFLPGYVAGEIYASLREYARAVLALSYPSRRCTIGPLIPRLNAGMMLR
jgi:Uma2 family endonuclease